MQQCINCGGLTWIANGRHCDHCGDYWCADWISLAPLPTRVE